ncbi:MAG TPA: carboxypeptidase-like regulatory domain-containing protein, partial [Blastocatellia bacterium]|nr:carboxypeptidase-like regulatory domain-containing protein [Blastocatellia bacterium]
MERSVRRRVACLAVMLLVLGFSFRSPTGDISGVIKDPSGAFLSGVPIMLQSSATRGKRTARSDANGAFRFAQLDPGNWSLSAEAPGFKRVVIPSVIVQVDQVTHVEMVLQVGDVSEVIEVGAIAPLLDTEKSTLSTVVDGRTIASLPLNARQFLDLALLTPGTVPAGPGTQGSGFSSEGARSQSNVYLLDGISNVDTQQNGPLNSFRI